jgi:hypothetical protein
MIQNRIFDVALSASAAITTTYGHWIATVGTTTSPSEREFFFTATQTPPIPGVVLPAAQLRKASSAQPSAAENGNMASEPTREEIDAKLAAADARNDARFERVIGEMRTSQAQLKGEIAASLAGLQNELRGDFAALKASSAGKLTVILTGVSTTLAMLAIIIAVIFGLVSSGQQLFGLGSSTREIAATAAKEAALQVIAAQKK